VSPACCRNGGGVTRSTPEPRRWLARVTRDDGEPVGPGSTKVYERCELLPSSSICPAVDPRKPSGPAAVSPRFKAGYTTASAVFAIVDETLCKAGAVHTRRYDPVAREQVKPCSKPEVHSLIG